MVPLPCSKCLCEVRAQLGDSCTKNPARTCGRNGGRPSTGWGRSWTGRAAWRNAAIGCHTPVDPRRTREAGAVRYTGGRRRPRSVAGADFDGHHRGDVAEEVHRDLKGPDGLDRLLQDEVVAIDLDPLLLLDGFRDVGTGDRAEEPATGAGSCRDEDVAPASTLAWASAAPRSFASRRSRVRRMEAAWALTPSVASIALPPGRR